MNIAIITARGGSKRIPKKNIRNFIGKPIISYPISAALDTNIFDEVMVSTDSEEIAEISKHYGANVPFLRSEKTSDDYATTKDVLDEVINEYRKIGKTFDIICCIYPCSPFLTKDILLSAYEKFHNSGASMLMPVVKYSHPIQRALQVSKKGYLTYREPDYKNTRTQDLDITYHDAGMFYFYNKQINDTTKLMFEIDELLVQDIDTEKDWKIAELKYSYQYSGGF